MDEMMTYNVKGVSIVTNNPAISYASFPVHPLPVGYVG